MFLGGSQTIDERVYDAQYVPKKNPINLMVNRRLSLVLSGFHLATPRQSRSLVITPHQARAYVVSVEVKGKCLFPKTIIANHNQNERVSPIFSSGWMRRDFLVFHSSYWPMSVRPCQKMTFKFFDLEIPNHRQVCYSCWRYSNRNIFSLGEYYLTMYVCHTF